MEHVGTRIVIRADASAKIGAGHVIRCLTLADVLKQNGAEITFLSQDMPHALAAQVVEKGHAVLSIADDEGCLSVLMRMKPDWLIVDHYGLGARFERAMRPAAQAILVIDDIADRAHDCDLLLDQNLGRDAEDYRSLVPEGCRLLIGPRYALLRPDFLQFRERSLKRRERGEVRHILISMGGFDSNNVTGDVLRALSACELPAGASISVVMGRDAPWIDDVRALIGTLPWPVEVLVGVRDMAQLMAESDLAIGAAGGAAWERAVLGLPALLVILADNQRPGANALAKAGAARLLPENRPIAETLCEEIAALMQPAMLRQTSRASAAITGGEGAQAVAKALLEAA
jgi:UDP-2,4-diacetamido-2,4,6-trideoxy-beta-L-altropyranose hydrolase